ncbi:MAG: hypothetical protein ACRYFZ_02980 [Janthinobacterium lividum]
MKTDFVKVGINDALSFRGFCNVHDTKIFKPIEEKVIDFSTYNSKILLNYRAIQNNIRKTLSAIQFGEKGKQLALMHNELLVMKNMIDFIDAQKEKLINTRVYESDLLNELDVCSNKFHFTVIKLQKLGIASSAVHQLETRSEVLRNESFGLNPFKVSLVFVHVIPREDHTLLVLSCRLSELRKVSKIIFEANSNPLKFISDTLIKRVETWICASSVFYQEFKDKKQKIIKEYERYPLFADADEYITLNLFANAI